MEIVSWFVESFEIITKSLSFDTSLLLEPDMIARLMLQVLLLMGSAFFSSSETALFSLSQLDLQKLRRDKHPRTNALFRLLEQPRRLIISILCGNELINVAAAANMAAILVTLYSPDKAEWINILIMVPLLLLVGEVTPKTIAVSNPLRYSTNIVAGPLTIWVWFITPVRLLVRFVADRVATYIVGEEKAPENLLHIDEFKTLVNEAEEEGGITPMERTLVYNLLSAGKTEIVEIMTPRTRVDFIDDSLPMTEIVEKVHLYRHNRLPVFHKHRDNITGFLHAEDLFRHVSEGKNIEELELRSLLHPPIGAPPTKKVDEMFQFFQENKAQAAVVINEFGGVDGLISLKSVLRFIFGHVMGPVPGENLYQEADENHYIVPGDMKLSDFNNLTHFSISDPRMTTVAGVLYRHLDRLPAEGDSVKFDGFSMTVVSLDGHRIEKVAVKSGSDWVKPAAVTKND